ncbi:gp53-like domain-containing protein, partial [Escherichia coli]|uniref:gp53-like domain-containing protein n=1 Tax=Escherichia coli TaxID=562 RepID=UPI0027B99A66
VLKTNSEIISGDGYIPLRASCCLNLGVVMIYSTGTISINGNTATGSGTNWTAPASQVRAGQTIIVMSNPVQMFQISSVNSATSMTVTPAASPALSGQKYGILVSDNISVDGLAQAMSQLIKEYDENIGAWETFATTSANQNITVTINGTSLSIPALGKLLQKGSNGALPVNQGGTGATNAADARTNLGLGEAAKRDVGTGENQIPDINSFLSVTGAAGYQKLPSGLIIQWGSATAGVGATGNTGNAINFSVSFPNICHQVVVSYDNGGGKVIAGAAGSFTKTNFLMRCDATSGVYVFRWFAIGS